MGTQRFIIPTVDQQKEIFPLGLYRIVEVSNVDNTKPGKSGNKPQQFYTLLLEKWNADQNVWGSSHGVKKAVLEQIHNIYFKKLAALKASGTAATLDAVKIPCRVGTVNSLTPYWFMDQNGVKRQSINHTLVLFEDEPITKALSARESQLEGFWVDDGTESGHLQGTIDPNMPLNTVTAASTALPAGIDQLAYDKLLAAGLSHDQAITALQVKP